MSYFDEDEEELGRSWAVKNIAALAILGIVTLLAFVYYGRLGISKFDNAMLTLLAVFLLVWMYVSAQVMWKHRSPKLIANNLHSSISGFGDRVGNYRIFRLGGVDALGFRTEGGSEGIVVIPEGLGIRRGKNVDTRAWIEPRAFNELPFDVQNFLLLRKSS